MPRFLLTAITVALLAACASEPVVEPDEAAPEIAAAPPPPPPPERAFPDDSFYELLVAEFALRRRDYDRALDHYVEQTPRLRDPGVSAHTTRLGQYLQREDETLEAAQLWVDLEPDNVEAHHTLARLLVRSGRNAEALPHLATMERAGTPANFPFALSNFNTLDARSRADLVAGINALATEFPDNTSLLLTRAIMHEQLGQDDRALAVLGRIFELEPQNTQGLLLEAQILAMRGADDPYARVDQALEQNPGDQLLRLRYARLLTATDLAAARTQFEILSAQSPRDGDLLFSLALINRELGDPLTARAYLIQLLELGQRIDQANYYLGRIEEDRGNAQAALRHYRAVGDGEEFLAACSRIGEIEMDRGELDAAGEWFAEQRARYPHHAERLYGLEAELLERAGEAERARALVDGALRESPDSASLLYTRAMMFERDDQLDAMEADLRRILANDPENATALNALGYTLANRTTRYDEALDLVSRALALEPLEPAILDSMGWVLFRLGRYEEALDYLSRAYAEFPDPEVAAHLGEVMWVSGDTQGAIDIWRAAALEDPDHPVLRETLQRLQVESQVTAPPTDASRQGP